MATAPSVSYSMTVRLEVPASGTAVSQLTGAVESHGGSVTGLDVTASGHEKLRIDVTIAATSTAHADEIVEQLRHIEGVTLGKVSDRTFLMHLGGKIEMASKHPIRNRDDLSMIYTPGVARVCMAIAENPEDARRLTIKRNSVAVVTDGSAVLGLGNIGPDQTTVFAGSVTFPTSPAIPGGPQTAVAWTANNVVRVQFSVPFRYNGGTLCVDVIGQPIAGQEANWWMADAEFEDIQGTAVEIGAGCGQHGGPLGQWSHTATRSLLPGAYARFWANGFPNTFAIASTSSDVDVSSRLIPIEPSAR